MEDYHGFKEVVDALIFDKLADLHTAVVCKVVKVDSTTIDCKPVITRNVKGVSLELPVFLEVPPIFLSGGSSSLRFPISVGDDCLVIISERCFDSWFNGQDYILPVDHRMHDYSDGFAIVGIKRSSEALTIPGKTAIEGDLDMVGDLAITGDASISGALSVSGNITCADIIVNGVSFNSHVHGGVEAGGGNTGGPQ